MTTLPEFQTKYNTIFDNIETFKSSITDNTEARTALELSILVTKEISTINTYTSDYNSSTLTFSDDSIAPSNFDDYLQWLNARDSYYTKFNTIFNNIETFKSSILNNTENKTLSELLTIVTNEITVVNTYTSDYNNNIVTLTDDSISPANLGPYLLWLTTKKSDYEKVINYEIVYPFIKRANDSNFDDIITRQDIDNDLNSIVDFNTKYNDENADVKLIIDSLISSDVITLYKKSLYETRAEAAPYIFPKDIRTLVNREYEDEQYDRIIYNAYERIDAATEGKITSYVTLLSHTTKDKVKFLRKALVLLSVYYIQHGINFEGRQVSESVNGLSENVANSWPIGYLPKEVVNLLVAAGLVKKATLIDPIGQNCKTPYNVNNQDSEIIEGLTNFELRPITYIEFVRAWNEKVGLSDMNRLISEYLKSINLLDENLEHPGHEIPEISTQQSYIESFGEWEGQYTTEQIEHLQASTETFDLTKFDEYKVFDQFIYNGDAYVVTNVSTIQLTVVSLYKNKPVITIVKQGSHYNGQLLDYNSSIPSPYNVNNANLNLYYTNSILTWIKDIYDHPISDPTSQGTQLDYNSRFSYLDSNTPMLPVFINGKGNTIIGINATNYLSNIFVKKDEISASQTDVFKIENHISHSQVAELIELDKLISVIYDDTDVNSLSSLKVNDLVYYSGEIYITFAKDATYTYLINKYKRQVWRHTSTLHPDELNGTKGILTVKETALALEYVKKHAPTVDTSGENFFIDLLTSAYNGENTEHGFVPFYTAGHTIVGFETGTPDTGIALIDPTIKSADNHSTVLHHPLIESLASDDRTATFLNSLYYFEKDGKMYLKQVNGDVEQLLYSDSGLNTIHSILHNNTTFAYIKDTYNKAEIDSKLDGLLRLDDLLLNETTLPWTTVPTEGQRTILADVFKVPETFYGLNVGKWGSDWAYNPLSLRTEEKVYLYKFNNFGTPQTFIEDIWSLWKKDTIEFPSNWDDLTEDQKHDEALKFVNKICGSSYKRSDFEHIGGTVSKLDHISPIKRSDLGKLYEYFVSSRNPPVFPFESNFSTPQKWSDEYGFTKEQFYNHFVKNTIITEHVNNMIKSNSADVSLESFLEWKTPLSDAQIDHIKEGVKSFDSTKYNEYKPLDKFVYDNEVYAVVTRSADDTNWIIISLLKNIGPIEIRANGDKVLITEYDNTLPSPYNTSGANLNLQYICSIISWIKHVQEHPISDATPEQINESYHKRFTFLEGHLPTFPIFTTEDGTIYGVNALGYLNDSFAKLHQIETGESVYATKKDTYTRPQIDTKIDSIFRTTNPLLSELRLFWESTPSEAQKTALLSTLKIPETYYALEEEGYGGDYATQPLSLNVGDKINIYKILNFGEKTHVIKDAWSLYKGPGDWDDLTEYQKRATLLAWINDICSSTYVLSNYTKPDGEVEELSHIVHIKRSDLGLLFNHFETDNDSDVSEIDGIVKTPKLYSEKNHLQKEDFYNLLRGKIENLTKVSIDSFVDWETQLTDEQIDFIKEDLHAWDQAKFDDYKIFDLFTYNNQVYICSRILGTNIFAINLLRNQGIVTFNRTINLVAFHDTAVTTVPAPFNTDLANLNLKYINSIYSWIEDHDNQAISNPTPGSSVFGDWDSRLSYITPEYSNFPTLPVFTNRQGKIFGVKAYSYLKEFFALKTDVKSHTTIESFHGWKEQLTNDQINYIREEVDNYDESKFSEYKPFDLFNYNNNLYIVANKHNDKKLFEAISLLRNGNVLEFGIGDVAIVAGGAFSTTLESPYNIDSANLNLLYVNSIYSFVEDHQSHVVSNPDLSNQFHNRWQNRYDYTTPESSNFPTIPLFTNSKGKMFGIDAHNFIKEYFAEKHNVYTRQQIDAQLDNRLSDLETLIVDNELLPYDADTNPEGLKWDEVPTESQREKLLNVLKEEHYWYGVIDWWNPHDTYIYPNLYAILYIEPFSSGSIRYPTLDELNTDQLRVDRVNEILGTSVTNSYARNFYWKTGDIQKLVNSGRYYKNIGTYHKGLDTPEEYARRRNLSRDEFFRLIETYNLVSNPSLNNVPDEINHKLYAKIKDVYNKPQIDAKFDGILRTEDLILNRDTVPWTTIPTTEKLQTLVTVLNTEAEYYSLVQEGYGSNIISQPLSLSVTDKVDIYQICNFKEESCVIRDIWSYYRGPSDWDDLTDYQKHSALLDWINNLCGSNYTLSNYIKKDGTTDVLSHIIHVKRSDLGKIFTEFRTADPTRSTEVQNIASTPEKYSALNHLTEDEFYDLLADKSLNVKAVNNASIESFHGWNEQLTDDQIDFIKAEVPELDMTKFDTYKVYDLFVQDDELYIIANIVDPSLYCVNLLRNYAVIKFSKDGSSDLIGVHGQFVEEPFNTDGANLSMKYINSVYSFVEDYQNHVVSNPDPQDEIAQSWENRFTYLDPQRSNFPTIPVFTNQKGKFFGVDGYDYFKNFFSLIGSNYTKHQVDTLLENRLAPLETKIIDPELEPFDEDSNPTGLRWTDRPTGSQKDKLVKILKAPVTYSASSNIKDNTYYFSNHSSLTILKFLPFEKVERYISGLNYEETKTILRRVAHVNSLWDIGGSSSTSGWYRPINSAEVETVLANVDFNWTKGTDLYDSWFGENTPKQYSEQHGLTEDQFRHLITQYEAKVGGQTLIENIGNDNITDDEFKDLGSTEIFDTARSRLEMLHTPHPWVDVIGTGSTITKMDSSNNIEANTYFAGVGKKASFAIIDRVGSQLKYFSNSFFVTLNTGNSKEFKDGLYSFDIHIEPPQNAANVRWHSFFVPRQTSDTTNKTFQYLATSDNINPNGSTSKTYFHSTLKSASPWQLNSNLYNHYFATKTGVNIKGNIKWTKATGDLLYWGDVWWLTNNDVWRHPFYVYYHMRNNVALIDIKWTFNANGNYNLVFPTKFNLSVRRESGH